MLKSNNDRLNKQTIFKLTAKNSKLLTQSKNLEKKNANLEKKVNSKAYRLGRLILHDTRSFISFIKFPKKVYEIWQNNTPKNNTVEEKKVSKKKVIMGLDFSTIQLPKKNISPMVIPNVNTLKIACIMDTFTYSVFEPEASFEQLTPLDWKKEIDRLQADILFVESAWRGKDDLWKGKICVLSQELIDIIAYCQMNNIVTIFWNKEDPFHYDEFIHTAKYFDYIFTTDSDMIQKYKEVLTHERIYLLPFACQPKLHNPIEKYTRKDAFSFAGAFYPNFETRSKIFESFIENLIPIGEIDIFDRNHNNPTSPFQYPEEYTPYIRGTLSYDEIDKAYKGYRYSINMSTIANSPTMFARRVFELAASNTMIISNYSKGIKNLFGELVISTDDGKELAQIIAKHRETNNYEEKIKLLALRKVMQDHTSEDRLNLLASKLTQHTIRYELPSVILLSYISSEKSLKNAIEIFNKQSVPHKKLILISADHINVHLSKDPKIEMYQESEEKTIAQVITKNDQFIAGISTDDYYAENYLLDLLLATRYSQSEVIGKASYFEAKEKQNIIHIKKENIYRTTPTLPARSSIVHSAHVSEKSIVQFSKELSSLKYTFNNMLSLDPFNYCKNGLKNNLNTVAISTVSDLTDIDTGITINFQEFQLKYT